MSRITLRTVPRIVNSAAGKVILMLSVVMIDQVTKLLAWKYIRTAPPRSYLGDLFRLEYAENSGAFLSLGAQLSGEVRFWIFVVAVSLFVFYVIWMLFKDKSLGTADIFAWCMIASGGVGNLIDRSTRENHGVIDFMNMGIGSLRTGIFNVADMAIMLGVFLLFGQFLTRTSKNPENAQ